MTRGLLPDTVQYRLDAELPVVMRLRERTLGLNPDFIAAKFEPMDWTPVAAVAFNDFTETMAATRIALFEYRAHGVYYREHASPPNPIAAIFFERYFLDDVAFRLYSAGEHLSTGIAFARNLGDSELKPFRKSRTPLSAAVGGYLSAREHDKPLTEAVVTLSASRDWQFAVAYRNRLVHEQPPTIHGLGLRYRRHFRWKVSKDGQKRRLDIGGADEPEFDVNTLGRHLAAATKELLGVGNLAVDDYQNVLGAHGFAFGEPATGGFEP